MAIRTIVTRGYGNGVFNGTIGDVVTRGFLVAAFIKNTYFGADQVDAINFGSLTVDTVYHGTEVVFEDG